MSEIDNSPLARLFSKLYNQKEINTMTAIRKWEILRDGELLN